MPSLFTEPSVLLVAFIAFWFGGAAIMSRIAGWHALSTLFPAPVRVQASEYRFATASVGPASCPIRYRRCLRVIAGTEGIGLCLMFPFRFYSPPFLVPWQSVAQCTEQQLFGTRKITFHFKGTERQVAFTGVLGQELKSMYTKATGQQPRAA